MIASPKRKFPNEPDVQDFSPRTGLFRGESIAETSPGHDRASALAKNSRVPKLLAGFLFGRRLLLLPTANRSFVRLARMARRPATTPPQPVQDLPNIAGMIPDPELSLDQLNL
jgi:hypothetical protein